MEWNMKPLDHCSQLERSHCPTCAMNLFTLKAVVLVWGLNLKKAGRGKATNN